MAIFGSKQHISEHSILPYSQHTSGFTTHSSKSCNIFHKLLPMTISINWPSCIPDDLPFKRCNQKCTNSSNNILQDVTTFKAVGLA